MNCETWKAVPGYEGYYEVSDMGRVKSLHRVVLLAFRGPPPAGHECAHNDGTRDNNELENLRYATRVENCADKVRHGTHCRGENSGMAKLTREDVFAIRRDKRVSRVIAIDYGVASSAIRRVKNGLRWSSVQESTQ